jgi:uncharacterized membrane protein YfhO
MQIGVHLMSFSKNIWNYVEENGLKATGFLLFLVGVVVYFDFLTFEKFMVANDMANDELNYYLPRYIFQSKRFWSQDFSMWSFQFGLGKSIYELIVSLNPFDRILFLFGEDLLIFAIPYITLMKHITAGILFYVFLGMIGISKQTAVIGALLYAYSGYMVLQGQWYRHQDYAIFITALLIAFERWFQRGKWLGLALVLGLLSMKQILTVYHLPIVLVIYALFRFIQNCCFSWRPFFSVCFKLSLILMLGIGINAFEILPSILHHLNAPRSSQGLDRLISLSSLTSLFDLSTAYDYLSVLYRLISSDLMGTMNRYKGILNPLEGPNIYIGILPLILIPQVFSIIPKAQAKPYWLLFICVLIYFTFPSVKMFLNVFVKYTYKATILYVVIFLLIMAVKPLDEMVKNTHLSKTALFIAVTALYIFLLTSYGIYSFLKIDVIDNKVLTLALCFIPIYGVILYYWSQHRFFPEFRTILYSVVIVELVVFSHVSINSNRVHIDPLYIKSRQGYFDHTREAIEFLKRTDPGIFRVEKDYISASHNDQLIQNYYGTTIYSDFNHPSQVMFSKDFFVPMIDTKWLFGLNKQPGLMSLVGVKYLIAKTMSNIPFGFRHIKSFDDVHLFENDLALPIGFAYDKYISYEDFKNLSQYQRERIVSKAFVASDPVAGLGKLNLDLYKAQFQLKSVPLSDVDIVVQQALIEKIDNDHRLSIFAIGDQSQIALDLSNKDMEDRILIRFHMDSRYSGEGRVTFGERKREFEGAGTLRFRVKPGPAQYRIDLHNPGKNIEFIQVDLPNGSGETMHITDFGIETMQFNFSYLEDIHRLSENEFTMTSFKEDHIQGKISVDSEKLLFLSIPHDEGWRVFVDGKESQPITANVGFIGITLTKGAHSVELKYVPPLMAHSVIISLVCLCLAFVVHRVYPRISALPLMDSSLKNCNRF